MFDRFRGNSQSGGGVVYAFSFKIASGRTQIPPPMIGAWVMAYALGETATKAAEQALQELRAMGYVVEDMDGTGGEILLARWDEHVAERWPEFRDRFPKQKEVLSVLEREKAVFGPFAGFE